MIQSRLTNVMKGNGNVSKASLRIEVKMSCTCGRSPIDKCVGWHKLSEVEYEEKKAAWVAKKAKNSEQTQ